MKYHYLRPSTWVVAVVAALAIGAAPVAAQQQNRKIDRAVRNAIAKGTRTQRVIVTVEPGYRETLRQALKKHGDVLKGDSALVNGVAADLHSVDVDELAQLPWVKQIASDAILHADAAKKAGRTSRGVTAVRRASKKTNTSLTGVINTPAIASKPLVSTLRQTLGLPAVATYGSMTGRGVGVAILDSGIGPSVDFRGRIAGFWDFTKGGVATMPFDDYGHGTHVAGLIGSSGRLSNYEFQGVAPEVRLFGFKVLDGTGAGYTSDAINALEFVIANRKALGIDIVNMSLGHPIYAPAQDDPLVQAVEKASASGLIVVVSAGNFGQKETTGETGYLGITSPGNAPSAITVGAADTKNTVTRSDDTVAPYSSRGPSWFDAFAKPDVVAPGHKLASDQPGSSYLSKLLKNGHVSAKNGQPFLELSGASMATAVASGVAALAVQAHESNGLSSGAVSPNLMKGILEYSAIGIAGFDRLSQGAGEINAAGAITLAQAIDTDVQLNKFWLSTGVTPASTIGGVSYPWSQQVIWNDTVLGGNIVYVNNVIWGTADSGDNIVWGTADDGDNIVWGTGVIVEASNIVWGTTAIWAPNDVWLDRNVGAMSDDGDNIVWGTADEGDNIVWGTADDGDNIVWGTVNASNIVWGMRQGGRILVATASDDGDNIVWGTSDDGDNIVWGTADAGDNIVWGTSDDGDNIVWGTSDDGDNIIWGTSARVF